jgi:large subunit ribosomal protein L4
MTAKVYGHDGAEKGDIDLSDQVFAAEVRKVCVHDTIRGELAARRVGTAKVKPRGEVAGSTRKPWRQKGTGRARAGSRKSPLWVGGGVTFGPEPRDFGLRVPRKVKRHAMTSILTIKTKQQRVRVIQDVRVESGKTRDLRGILDALGEQERTVLVVREDDEMVRRAGRNIRWLSILRYDRLSAHELFYGRRILIEESAVPELARMYALQRGTAS